MTIRSAADMLIGALQDALSKTIPIWAALLNRAVARVRTPPVPDHADPNSSGRSDSSAVGGDLSDSMGSKQSPATSDGQPAAQANCSGCGDESWDTRLHLPPWLPRSEYVQVEDRMNGWLDSLMEVWPSALFTGTQLTLF